jgi:pimeloyl-ACP methyl ester carboxylesterase
VSRPAVVQLLGDKDDVVSTEDSRDVTVARDFIWVKVHNTGHADLIDLKEPVLGLNRKKKLQQALGNDSALEELRRGNFKPPDDRDFDVEVVVFVLHGIRDMGAWTSQFEGPLQQGFQHRNGGSQAKIYIHRARYGYFAMGPFLLWADRQVNVRWFMDQYTELKARFPRLREIHFIGHSNGTYVLASALQKYKTLKMDRVVFAGSVVRIDYPWSDLKGRIRQVRNYVASSDCVVGVFPRLFEFPLFAWINRDIGSAGFNGFIDSFGNALETKFVKGGHPAALEPANIPSIIDFVLDGKKTDIPEILTSSQPTFIDYISRVCWLIWLLLGLVLIAGGWAWVKGLNPLLKRAIPQTDLRGTVALGLYFGFIWVLLQTL